MMLVDIWFFISFLKEADAVNKNEYSSTFI